MKVKLKDLVLGIAVMVFSGIAGYLFAHDMSLMVMVIGMTALLVAFASLERLLVGS